MLGGSKQRYKQFTINSAQDACVVLASLISGLTLNLAKYKEYSLEVDALLESSKEEYIDAKLYDDINDKLLFRQHEMLKLTADHQSSSFSYIDLRTLLVKHGYLTTDAPEDVNSILSELLDVRNWTFHNPQSRLVAARDAAEKSIPKQLKGTVQIKPQLNPIIISKITQYEFVMLGSLAIHTSKRIVQFERILEQMKIDYQEIYDTIEDRPFIMTPDGLSDKVHYMEKNIISGLSDYQSDIAQISMAIQKSKYDGSEEKFNDWVIRPAASNLGEDNTTTDEITGTDFE